MTCSTSRLTRPLIAVALICLVADAGADGAPGHGEAEGIEIPEEEVDYRALHDQARSVIQVGILIGAALRLWSLWGDLVPAFGFTERVELPFSRITIAFPQRDVHLDVSGPLAVRLDSSDSTRTAPGAHRD